MIIYGKQAVLEALQEGSALRLMIAHGVQAGTVKELEHDKLAAQNLSRSP